MQKQAKQKPKTYTQKEMSGKKYEFSLYNREKD